ncbi:MAG TPA: hypothetical protein VD862_00965 [Candidatus Paceibacterota bacterium]|nr:hypothetical protein [Candidatus Paceibacterota bacterium]
MAQDWTAKRARRENGRWMRYAIWAWVLAGLMQSAALYRVLQMPDGGVKVRVTLEDTYFTYPDGTEVVVDRWTGLTTVIRPDGTVCIGEHCRKYDPR